jgi:hypothetical protein
VVDVNAEGPSSPLAQTALGASILQEPGSQKATLDVGTVPSADEQRRYRHCEWPRFDLAAPNGLNPRGMGNSETLLTFPKAVALIVIAPYLSPVMNFLSHTPL